jgi:hypothetical protein
MDISSFEDLLAVARGQSQPQRLLFVFAKVVLPKDADEEERRRFEAGAGGGLQPMMSVDKRPEDLADFASLVEESAQMGQEWHIAFVASLGGEGGQPPTAEAADNAIEYMVNTIQSGGDISRFMAFTREGEPLDISLSG